MKIHRWKELLRVASGIAFVAAASSIVAQEQEPRDSKPTTSATQGSSATAPIASPGATQSKPTTSLKAPPDQFTSMDTNKDRKISAGEYASANMAAFRSMDKDSDGKVSALELTEAQPAASGSPTPLSSAQIGEIDSNKDQQLTKAEVSSGASRMFNNLDVNHDSVLSANELNGRQYRSDTEASADSRKNSVKDSQKQ